MHVTRYYFIGCHSVEYRAERFSAAVGHCTEQRGIELRGNVQHGIVTKPNPVACSGEGRPAMATLGAENCTVLLCM